MLHFNKEWNDSTISHKFNINYIKIYQYSTNKKMKVGD